MVTRLPRKGARRPAVRSQGDAADDDAVRAMDSLRRVVHALRVATRTSQESLGVTGAQQFVLRQLSLASGQSLSDLARRTRTTQSSVSEVVSRLVKRGLISRSPSPDDRRRAVLALTPAGAAVLEGARETVQERLIAGFGRLGEAERRALADGLEAWLAASVLSEVEAVFFFEDEET